MKGLTQRKKAFFPIPASFSLYSALASSGRFIAQAGCAVSEMRKVMLADGREQQQEASKENIIDAKRCTGMAITSGEVGQSDMR